MGARERLNRLAKALLERESLEGEQIEKVLAGEPLEPEAPAVPAAMAGPGLKPEPPRPEAPLPAPTLKPKPEAS